MATTTPNYGWVVPTSTDLVKDGATAIETLGDSADATVKALNPETTLGDLAYRSATANTNTRLAIGSTGNVLTVSGGVPVWATPAAAASGLNLITTNSFASSSAVNVDSCFTSTYTNYKIIVDVTGSSGSNIMLFRLRSGGSTDTATTYNYYSYDVVVGGVGNSSAANQNNMFGFPTNSRLASVSFDLLNPQIAEYTKALPHAMYDDGSSPGMRIFSATKNNTTQYDGFALVATSGSFSGNYWVYGYQKA